MTLTIILTAILSLGVAVMVITPLVWAIATQRHDRPATARHGAGARQRASQSAPRRAPRPQYKPISGRA
jgi:hypothetical protein